MYILYCDQHALHAPMMRLLEIVPGQDSLLTFLHCWFLRDSHDLVTSLHTNLHLHGVLVLTPHGLQRRTPTKKNHRWPLFRNRSIDARGHQFTTIEEEEGNKNIFPIFSSKKESVWCAFCAYGQGMYRGSCRAELGRPLFQNALYLDTLLTIPLLYLRILLSFKFPFPLVPSDLKLTGKLKYTNTHK